MSRTLISLLEVTIILVWRAILSPVLPESIANCPYVAGALLDVPLGLVIVRSGESFNPMTVSCFGESAHYPTSMWISIHRDNFTHELLEKTKEFSFITLDARQGALAVACGTSSGRTADKRGLVDGYEEGGYLFVRGAIASAACRISHSVAVGDHTLFIADMLSGNVDRQPGAIRNLLMSDLHRL